jgi:hypothetical protein
MFRSEINKLMENVLESGQPRAYVSPPVFLTQLAQLHVANAEKAAMRMLEESEKELAKATIARRCLLAARRQEK